MIQNGDYGVEGALRLADVNLTAGVILSASRNATSTP